MRTAFAGNRHERTGLSGQGKWPGNVSRGGLRMRSNHYIHPEVGWLLPTDRLRRALRIGLLSTLFGMGVGVAAITALGWGDSTSDGTTGGGIASPVVASSGIPLEGSMPPERLEAGSIHNPGITDKADTDGRNTNTPATGLSDADRGVKTCRADDRSCSNPTVGGPRRKSPTHDSPVIARVPLGRSDVFATRGLRQEGAESGAAESVPLPRKKPRKIAHQNPSRDEALHYQRPEDAGAIIPRREANRMANTRSSVRDRSTTPTGFWAWSR
jgi:hypothetical protein